MEILGSKSASLEAYLAGLTDCVLRNAAGLGFVDYLDTRVHLEYLIRD